MDGEEPEVGEMDSNYGLHFCGNLMCDGPANLI